MVLVKLCFCGFALSNDTSSNPAANGKDQSPSVEIYANIIGGVVGALFCFICGAVFRPKIVQGFAMCLFCYCGTCSCKRNDMLLRNTFVVNFFVASNALFEMFNN